MDKLIEMLEAMVSQGEAQFKCGDDYATFSKQTIALARKVLDQRKKALSVEQAAQISLLVYMNPHLSDGQKLMVSCYMIGQADANMSATKAQVEESIEKLVGQKIKL